MFHFCYGDSNHKHVVEPTDMGDMVDVANRLSADIKRTIELIHMPVPRDRKRRRLFCAARTACKLKPETELCLGLVHYTDGVVGTRKRLATAERYASALFDCDGMRFWPAGPGDHPGFAAYSCGCRGLTWATTGLACPRALRHYMRLPETDSRDHNGPA